MVFRTFLLLCLLFALWVVKVQANDSNAFGIGGRWQMLGGEHKQIQMVREHVRIVPYGDSFQTTADFIFRNYGGPTTVRMGFPEYQYGDVPEGDEGKIRFRKQSSMSNFRSWVDGCPVTVKRHVTHDYGRALWVKTVHFKRNQTRRVRVRYVSASGGGDSSGTLWVSYQFTGGNWRGEVEQSVLDVELPQGAYVVSRPSQTSPAFQRQQRGNHFHFRWTHWQAQKDFDLDFFPVFPNDLLLHLKSTSLSPAAKPTYRASGSGQLLPYVRENASAECILLRGRLWVAASMFSRKWDEKRHGLVINIGQKQAFISAKGAARRSSLWPLAPNGTFWISDGSQNNTLMIPARQITRQLGGRFIFDFSRGQAIWVQGKTRKIFHCGV